MKNSHNNNFTLSNYRKALKSIQKNKISFYKENFISDKFILWRHDVDLSLNSAFQIATLEKEESIYSTFFLRFNSRFYNIFEEESIKIINNIFSLGHEIGLHFDPNLYDIKSKIDLEEKLAFEKNILENLFNIKIKVFSFHNPTTFNIPKDYKLAGMINTYAEYFQMNVKYCSDSNGYWRFESLEDVLNGDFDKLQILTHPGWWQEKEIPPQKRIKKCIDDRADNTYKIYCELLEKCGRDNRN